MTQPTCPTIQEPFRFAYGLLRKHQFHRGHVSQAQPIGDGHSGYCLECLKHATEGHAEYCALAKFLNECGPLKMICDDIDSQLNAFGRLPADSATTRSCPSCLNAFKAATPWQRFCSPDCRNKFHNGKAKAAKCSGSSMA